MPLDGEPLSTDEIATLTTWIEKGAEWPNGVDFAEATDDPAAGTPAPAAAAHFHTTP